MGKNLMTPPPEPTTKDYLAMFIMSFSVAAILLSELKPTKKLNRSIAMAIATCDTIKDKLETADEVTLKAMVIGSRRNLEQVRQAVNMGSFNIQSAKARREWLGSCKNLLKETSKVNA